MKREAQRIAIAEACGWKNIRECTCKMVPRGTHTGKDVDAHLPDYLEDLNAMHEAEKVLDVTNGGPVSGDCLRYAYSRELYKLVPTWVQPFRATAAQRAEAFLRTIGKWGEAKP